MKKNEAQKQYQKVLKESIDTYKKYKTSWIEKFKTEKGFDEWFIYQILKEEKQWNLII